MDIDYAIAGFAREGDHAGATVVINGTEYRIGIPHSANPMFWVN